jgi:hypothetical protein
MSPSDFLPKDEAPTPVEGPDVRAALNDIWMTDSEELNAAEKREQVSAVVLRALLVRGSFYYNVECRDCSSTMFFDRSLKVLRQMDADDFKTWLSGFTQINLTDTSFKHVFADLQVNALQGTTSAITPEAYWAHRNGATYISSGDGQMYRITGGNVELVDNGTDGVLFPAGKTLYQWKLVEPKDPFHTCRLFREIRTTAEHGKLLYKLWIICMLSYHRCKPILAMIGGVGSGKTRALVGFFELLGMSPRIIALTENGENDIWTSFDHGGLSVVDNADTRIKWFADTLAMAATDGNREKRRLYTDSTLVKQRVKAWTAVTSANPTFSSDAGLADRLIVVRLERRKGATAESALSDEIAANRDAGLSYIALTLAAALADTKPVPTGLNARHPDWADMAVRVGRALGVEKDAIASLSAAEADKSVFNVENDEVGSTLIAVMEQMGEFQGDAALLLQVLRDHESVFKDDRIWNTKRIGKRLSRIWPHLEAVLGAKLTVGHAGVKTYYFGKPKDKGAAGNSTCSSADAGKPTDAGNSSANWETTRNMEHKLRSTQSGVDIPMHTVINYGRNGGETPKAPGGQGAA